MDKAKGIVKGGWHPAGDPTIHRKTWKSDIKGMASGKKESKSTYDNAMAHQSRPLGSLQEPSSFGPPPKHREYYDQQGNALNPTAPTAVTRYQAPERSNRSSGPGGGWGSVVPTSNRKQEEEDQKQQEEEARAERGPFQMDTTGINTQGLPPPVRRAGDAAAAPAPAPAPPVRNNVASPRSPPVPQRQAQTQARPPPALPPRMNDHPDEHTPPPPPSYNEATTQPPQQDPATLNTGAVNRLGQAGVSVPGFGIGGNQNSAQQSPASPQGHTGQLSELQQRFARMNTGDNNQTATASSPSASTQSAAAAAAQKKPPPPPPKKSNITGAAHTPTGGSDGSAAPPPLPLASKPRPN